MNTGSMTKLTTVANPSYHGFVFMKKAQHICPTRSHLFLWKNKKSLYHPPLNQKVEKDQWDVLESTYKSERDWFQISPDLLWERLPPAFADLSVKLKRGPKQCYRQNLQHFKMSEK